jgi:hypothetical protein
MRACKLANSVNFATALPPKSIFHARCLSVLSQLYLDCIGRCICMEVFLRANFNGTPRRAHASEVHGTADSELIARNLNIISTCIRESAQYTAPDNFSINTAAAGNYHHGRAARNRGHGLLITAPCTL